MTPGTARWEAPPLSSDLPAIASYRVGVAALVSGSAHASDLLTTAIGLDPGFALARAALAVALVRDGRAYEALPSDARVTSRAERQHLEIVHAALSGDARRAHDLRREHLLEFPGDVLIVWLPLLQHEMRCGRVGDRA